MIRTDSRKVRKGDVFVALPGISSNGDQYIDKAIAAGADRIICSNREKAAVYKDTAVEFIFTDDPRAYLEELLVQEYCGIIDNMTLIAVTGTNGKTTTCSLVAKALGRLGRKCGYIGTIGFYLDEKVRDLPNTSVDICDLYELLLEAHEKGYDTVALEASSQGLAMGRLHTLSFDIGVFTNLTEDHLDYHLTMDRYAKAKQELFRHIKPGGAALVNSDDPYSSRFLLDQNINYTYGIHSGDFWASQFRFREGTDLTWEPDGKKRTIHTGLIGRYNVYNTMAVIGVLWILGYSPDSIDRAMTGLTAPEGRCDLISYNGSTIVIDGGACNMG